jgi:hypothetical protein
MAKPTLKLVSTNTVNRTVAPGRRPNAELRTREHLTPKEVDRLIRLPTAIGTGTVTARWSCLPIGTAYARRNYAIFAGTRSISIRLSCTSAESSRAHPQRTL